MTALRLGTRRSLLAMAQSRAVARALGAAHPGLEVALVGIETRGDRVQELPLRAVEGKEFFTAEIDRALLAGEIDLAVHSLKDLSLARPEALCTAAVPRRENPRDVVLFAPDAAARVARGETLVVGTSSPRRLENLRGFLAAALPGGAAKLRFEEIRGNVDSRLRRLFEPEGAPRRLDAVALAFAGLIRLWADEPARVALADLLARVRWMIVPLGEAPAAPGQGALAIECRTADARTRELLAVLHDPATAEAVARERALLAEWGGGCHQRFGATCVRHDRIGRLFYIRGAKPDGTPVAEMRWPDRPELAKPATVRAWDGTRTGRARIERLASGAEALAGLEPGAPVFISNERALPAGSEAALAHARLYVPGMETWRRLAARGLWVEGCAEGLSFEALRPTLAEPVLGLPSLAHWAVLTHEGAAAGWAPARALSTYRLLPPDAAQAAPRTATHVYWASASQHEFWRAQLPAGVHHACGAGKTAATLTARGVAPLQPFPSVEEWRAWLDLPAISDG